LLDTKLVYPLSSVFYILHENSNEVRDYETFLVFTTVIKYSAKFWLDAEIGGLNNYENFSVQRGAPSSKKDGENV